MESSIIIITQWQPTHSDYGTSYDYNAAYTSNVYSYRWGTPSGTGSYPNAAGYAATTIIPVWGLAGAGVDKATVNAALDEMEANTIVNGTHLIAFERHDEAPSPNVATARGIWIQNDSRTFAAGACVGNTFTSYVYSVTQGTITQEVVAADGVYAPVNAATQYINEWNSMAGSTNGSNSHGIHTIFATFGSGCMDVKHLIVHEIGHAMGFENHFNGFGTGPTCTTGAICMTPFYRVLKTLYAAPPHSDINSITAK